MKKRRPNSFYYRTNRRRRFSPLILVGVLVPVVLVLAAGAIFVIPKMISHAAPAVNGDCSLIVPADPLSAQGLATPYQLTTANVDNGACSEANKMQAAFVQGAIFDPATSTISIYNPLVIDQGTQPAVAPTVPQLPQGAIVALWFGSNGNTLTLQGTHKNLQAANCVNGANGANGSTFGQFSYCNAPAFFQAANHAIRQGKLTVPALGMAKDGETCPTVRDFGVVDQDQSDNVTTTYLIAANGQTAQMNAANTKALTNAQTQTNGSDNRLLSVALDGALGCVPWMAPDLANGGQPVPALPLDELQAAAHQAAPVAFVPEGDPMVLVNNHRDLKKLSAYRAGVDQPSVQNAALANTRAYCINLRDISPARMLLDSALTAARPSADSAVASSLLTFLEQRFVTTYGPNGLNCMKLLGQPDPITVTTDTNGIAINGTINGIANGMGGNGNGTGTAPNCSVNGTTVTGCTGTTTINGQSCTFAFDANTKQVNITCASKGQP